MLKLLLQKKIADLTVEEFIIMQEVNKKQPKQLTTQVSVSFIDDLLVNNYEQAPFNKPITKFSEIYDYLSAQHTVAISKKALVKALLSAGYISKIKAVKGGTTARFFSARLKS